MIVSNNFGFDIITEKLIFDRTGEFSISMRLNDVHEVAKKFSTARFVFSPSLQKLSNVLCKIMHVEIGQSILGEPMSPQSVEINPIICR